MNILTYEEDEPSIDESMVNMYMIEGVKKGIYPTFWYEPWKFPQNALFKVASSELSKKNRLNIQAPNVYFSYSPSDIKLVEFWYWFSKLVT